MSLVIKSTLYTTTNTVGSYKKSKENLKHLMKNTCKRGPGEASFALMVKSGALQRYYVLCKDNGWFSKLQGCWQRHTMPLSDCALWINWKFYGFLCNKNQTIEVVVLIHTSPIPSRGQYCYIKGLPICLKN